MDFMPMNTEGAHREKIITIKQINKTIYKNHLGENYQNVVMKKLPMPFEWTT